MLQCLPPVFAQLVSQRTHGALLDDDDDDDGALADDRIPRHRLTKARTTLPEVWALPLCDGTGTLLERVLMCVDRRTYGRVARVCHALSVLARELFERYAATLQLRRSYFVGAVFDQTEHWQQYQLALNDHDDSANVREQRNLVQRRLMHPVDKWVRLYETGTLTRMRDHGGGGATQPLSHGFSEMLDARTPHGVQRHYAVDGTVVYEAHRSRGRLHGAETQRWSSEPHALLLRRTWSYGYRVDEEVFLANNMPVSVQRCWTHVDRNAPTSVGVTFYDERRERVLLRIESGQGLRAHDAPLVRWDSIEACFGALPLPGALSLRAYLAPSGGGDVQACYRHWYLVQRGSLAHALLYHLRYSPYVRVAGYETNQLVRTRTGGDLAAAIHLVYCKTLTRFDDHALVATARSMVGNDAAGGANAPLSQPMLSALGMAMRQQPNMRNVQLTPLLADVFPGIAFIR